MVATVYFLLLLAFGYGALAIFLYFYQPRLLYLPGLPTRELVATPKQIGLEYQEIRITTQDDVALSGWFLPHQQPRATLLFLHGNAGNISHRLESLDIFHHLGLAVLIIDYRGYGQSSGRPSEEGTYQDAAAALRYLGQRGVPPDRVVVFGRSLGAPIAAWLASREPVAALIVESAFASAPQIAAKLYPWLPVRWLTRFRYDTAGYAAKTSSPVLVIHSLEDDIIPFEQGRIVYDSLKGESEFLELTGGHNDGFLVSGARYTNGIDRFLTAHVDH
ncbi:MAG TPA: alpha/beta hydrolase [Arenicellales bacterium]|jgi:hypothetical protein|nr:alpha/beta hydrolase [Arenicellales bacterium]|tara:strand:+ start:685 stop:1509 length:825 start_codon:yes stop_codon:yes gene_type:complete